MGFACGVDILCEITDIRNTKQGIIGNAQRKISIEIRNRSIGRSNFNNISSGNWHACFIYHSSANLFLLLSNAFYGRHRITRYVGCATFIHRHLSFYQAVIQIRTLQHHFQNIPDVLILYTNRCLFIEFGFCLICNQKHIIAQSFNL